MNDAKAGQREGAITVGINALMALAKEYEEIATLLNQRLMGACRPSVPTIPGDQIGPESVPAAPIARDLKAIENSLKISRGVIADVLSRMEL